MGNRPARSPTLERARLVERTILGREHRLRLEAGPLREAARWLEHCRVLGQPARPPPRIDAHRQGRNDTMVISTFVPAMSAPSPEHRATENVLLRSSPWRS